MRNRAYTNAKSSISNGDDARQIVSRFRLAQLCQYTKVLERCSVARDICAAGDFLEKASHDFSAARLWQCFSKANFVRLGDCADVRADMIAQFRFERTRRIDTCLQRDKGDNALTFQLVRPPDYGRFSYLCVADKCAFDFRCAKPVSSNVQDVVDSTNDPEIAIFVAARAISSEIITLKFAPVLFSIARFVA